MIQFVRMLSGTGILCATCASLTLAGCAGSGGKYPSFAMPAPSQEAGRVSAQFPGVTVREPVDAGAGAQPLPQELDARLAALSTRAANASRSFGQSAAATARLVRAARSSEIGSDAWAEAQLSLAALSSHYSDGRLALAELDILASNARITLASQDTLAQIAEVQNEVSARLDGQARILDDHNATLKQ